MKNKKILISIVAVTFLTLAGATVYYFQSSSYSRQNASDMNVPSDDIDYFDASPADEGDKIQPSSKDEQAKPNGTNNSSSEQTETIRLTYAQQNDDMVNIRSLIEGTTSGTCTATLKHGSSTLTKSAPLITQGAYITCQGFNIPVSEFAHSGTWQAQLSLKTSSGSVTSDSMDVEVTL